MFRYICNVPCERISETTWQSSEQNGIIYKSLLKNTQLKTVHRQYFEYLTLSTSAIVVNICFIGPQCKQCCLNELVLGKS